MTISTMTAGAAFRAALRLEHPLQIAGTINAYTALMAERVGFRAIYLSGAAVANGALGLPDLGITTLNDMLEDARRITNAVDIPLLVDASSGFGGAFNIARTVQDMTRTGVAGIHLCDQTQTKRYGHHSHTLLVTPEEMADRIKASVDARLDPDFVIMARTDALAVEGIIAAIERAEYYQECGADMIFFEGVRELKQYQMLTNALSIPVMANLDEFSDTPLFTLDELAEAGIEIVLYPLSAFRAMNTAALKTYVTIREEGSQMALLDEMQTPEAMADFLNVEAYEDTVDEIAEEDTHENHDEDEEHHYDEDEINWR